MTLNSLYDKMAIIKEGHEIACKLTKSLLNDQDIVLQWKAVKNAPSYRRRCVEYHALNYLLEWYMWKRPDNHGMGS